MVILLFLIRATIVLGAAFGAAHLLRRRSAAMRADLWRATFVALAVMPIAMVVVPALPWLPAVGSEAARPVLELPLRPDASGRRVTGSLFDGRSIAAEKSSAGALEGEQVPAPVGSEARPIPVSDTLDSLRRPAMVALIALWLVGALWSVVRLILGLRTAASIVSGARSSLDVGKPDGVAIVVSERATGPFVWDPRPFGPATVVLPADESPAGPWRRAVLAHELHHVDRRDGAYLALATVVAAFLWPTPLARLALGRLRLETERAADDAVLRAGVRASDYAGGLVSLASGAAALPVPGMGMGGTVTKRIESLLERGLDRRNTGHGARRVAASGALVLCATIGSLTTCQAQEPRAQDPAAELGTAKAGLHARAIEALVGMQNAGSGAWHGDVGYKLNSSWKVTAEDAPHVGVTGLAVEALVLAGQTPDDSEAGQALSAGIDFLLESQDEKGYFTANGTRMRSHASATHALAMALEAGIERDVIVPALVKSLGFIIKAQSTDDGGWRFQPFTQESDILETAYQQEASRQVQLTLAAVAPAALVGVTGVMASNRRAWKFAQSTRVTDPEDHYPGAFRYQTTRSARVTVNTIAAGTLTTGVELYNDIERWQRNVEQMRTLRALRMENLDGPEGHFLIMDAELLLERVFDGHRPYGSPLVMEPAGEWRQAREAMLAEHQLGSGAWTCTTGPGDAYITAIGCILLAPNR